MRTNESIPEPVGRSNTGANEKAVSMLIDVCLRSTLSVASKVEGLVNVNNNSKSLDDTISLVNTVISSELSRRFGGVA